MDTLHSNSAVPTNAFKTQPASVTSKFAKVPNRLLGAVLDHGKPSAYAAHMLAVKVTMGTGWSLNEQRFGKAVEAGGYDIGRRAFRAGVRLLKVVGVLRRTQRGRTWAVETVSGCDGGFVALPEDLLRRPSKLVAFILAANLSPTPRPASAVAKRVGVTSKATIRKLVREALETGQIAAGVGARGVTLVARKGHIFDQVKNVLVKNVPAKNVPTHSRWETPTEDEKRPLHERTRSDERDVPARKKDLESDWIVLKDWRSAPFFRERQLFDGEVREVMSLDGWKKQIRHHGGAPDHVATPAAHRQALELAHELHFASSTGGARVTPHLAMIGLAFAVCKAHAEGRTIRSLGFVGQGLVRRCNEGDDSWAHDLPSRIDPNDFQTASRFADQVVTALEGWKIRHSRRELLSTYRVEQLADMIHKYSWNGVMHGINRAIAQFKSTGNLEPDLGATEFICGWGWFDDHVEKAKREAGEAKRAALHQRAAAWDQQRAVVATWISKVQRAAEVAAMQLAAAGIEVDARRLQYPSQLRKLANYIPAEMPIEQVLTAAVSRWLGSTPNRPKVSAWSNMGDAIRAEVAAEHAKRRVAANAAAA